ncbi:MAG: hypothetical protein JXL84_20035, partial [Deltaproteobacteria bacterium]|nr:hypothetical protein [Deltaproteobacteria bacterium]
MKRSQGFLRCALIAVMILTLGLLLASAASAFEFKKEYKMQLNVGPKFYWGMGAQKFADLVKE